MWDNNSTDIARTVGMPDTGFSIKYHIVGAMTPFNTGSFAFIIPFYFGLETFFRAFFSACLKYHTGWTFKI